MSNQLDSQVALGKFFTVKIYATDKEVLFRKMSGKLCEIFQKLGSFLEIVCLRITRLYYVEPVNLASSML